MIYENLSTLADGWVVRSQLRGAQCAQHAQNCREAGRYKLAILLQRSAARHYRIARGLAGNSDEPFVLPPPIKPVQYLPAN